MRENYPAARTSPAAFASANPSLSSPPNRIGVVRRSVILLAPSIVAAASVATPPSVAFSHRRAVADAGGFAFASATAAPALPLAVRPPLFGSCADQIRQDAEVAVSRACGPLALGLASKAVGGYRGTKRTILSSISSFDVNECDARIVSTRGGNGDWNKADIDQRYKPYQHGVVLLGAYEHCSRSHDDKGAIPGKSRYWDRLLPYLDGTAAAPDVRDANDQQSLFCYAPAMPGTATLRPCGTGEDRASCVDWLAHGREATILAKTICDRVTIVGHSVGALVAAAISEETNVDRLVLTGPNFLPSPDDKRIKKLGNSLLGNFLNSLQAIRRRFAGREPCHDVPLHFLRETFQLQDRLARPWKVREVVMVMGAEDYSLGSLSEQINCISRFVPDDAKVEVHTVKDAGHDLCLEGERALQELAEVISRPPLEEHAFFSIRE